ncbi:MAG: phosphoglycerate mutase [bacterium]|nr:MAG: phosphoglycerate mutase [bacterium]
MKQLHYGIWKQFVRPFALSCLLLLISMTAVAIGATPFLPQDDFKVTTVFLVRHAEKATSPPEDPPLLETGNLRSQELIHILGKASIKAIYTSQYLRTKQTAEPLAKHLGIESITIPIKNPQESLKEIVKKVYEKAGDNVLIVGHSNTVPEIIKALGVDVDLTIDEKEYDNLFVVTIYAKGKATVTHLKYGK